MLKYPACGECCAQLSLAAARNLPLTAHPEQAPMCFVPVESTDQHCLDSAWEYRKVSCF